MIVDAYSIPNNESVETDVCIVGAGLAGITLAREFINQDFKVCLLESGSLENNLETQSLYRGDNVGHPYFPLDQARIRFFGGSTNAWHVEIGGNCPGARVRPLNPIDFEKRHWVPYSGWPFDKSYLDPYYNRAQSICKVKPTTFKTSFWEDTQDRPRFPLRSDFVKTIIFKFTERDTFNSEYRSQVTRGAANIITFLHSNVVEIDTNDRGKSATRLRVACLGGDQFWVSAKVFVLATGGIEIPRLLLSSNKVQKTGLGNQNDLVGRFFMEHLHYQSGVFVPSDPELFQSAVLYNQVHTVNGVPIIGKLTLADKVLRREELLNQNVQLLKRNISAEFFHPRVPMGSLGNTALNIYRGIRRKTMNVFSRGGIKAYRFANMTEQAPNPDSRVTLSNDRDHLGQNRVRLDWRLSPIDILSAKRTHEIIGSELNRARLGRLYIQLEDETPPKMLHGGYHHMGTTRMHVDPKQGVTDENCRVHGISNLFIAGPSVFPTGGYANPVLTTIALTVRLADNIKRMMLNMGSTSNGHSLQAPSKNN